MQMAAGVDLWTHVAVRTTSRLARVIVVELGHPEVSQLEVALAV